MIEWDGKREELTMMKCPHCGVTLPMVRDAYCGSCGAELPTVSSTEAIPERRSGRSGAGRTKPGPRPLVAVGGLCGLVGGLLGAGEAMKLIDVPVIVPAVLMVVGLILVFVDRGRSNASNPPG